MEPIPPHSLNGIWEAGAIMVVSSVANAKQHQTVRVAMRTMGHVVLAPIALIMIVLGGVVFSLVLIYAKLMQL